MLGFLKNIGPTELILIGVIIVFLFGGKLATKIGKATGETFKEIKKIKNSFSEAVKE